MKKAFTLAEVLVTMAILAIIGAFIIPILIETTPNESRVLYKKIFHEMALASQNLINDNSKYTSEQTGYLVREPASSATENFCTDFITMVNTAGATDCAAKGSSGSGGAVTVTPNFATTSGVQVWGIGGGATSPFTEGTGCTTTAANRVDLCYTTIVLDVNGAAGPNVIANETTAANAKANQTNYDRFKMRLYASGKVSTGDDSERYALENMFLSEPTTIRKTNK